jgi:hypothetical protein
MIMKFKLTVILATFVVALGLLLGTSAAQAQVDPIVVDPIVIVDGDSATSIQYLEVEGILYDVSFFYGTAYKIYGTQSPDIPYTFEFTDSSSAQAAVEAVNWALNTHSNVTKVGQTDVGQNYYGIGYHQNPESVTVQGGNYNQGWQATGSGFFNIDDWWMYAKFDPANGYPPDPVTIGGIVTGLAGSGLLLQNNLRDDLAITEDEFTFSEPLTPGDSYNVTVAFSPTTPKQICIVTDGEGTVPLGAVTNVIVTCVDAPEQVTIGGSVTGLVGSGLVLQINGTDDEPIFDNVDFTFNTPRDPGTFYEVTVATNPTNLAQTCSVENGTGHVPLDAVTNVIVTCAEPVLGDVIPVAKVGDTLPDNTLLTAILLDGGVAINWFGTVAFGGKDDANNIAVFTQDGLVVAEGGTLLDNTIVGDLSPFGKVAISAGWSGEMVAFHGQTSSSNAVFTQDGPVTKVGDTLPDNGIVENIYDGGKVAINNMNQVALHGKVKYGSGLGSEEFRAVFTSEGVKVRENQVLNGDQVEAINESGGVAIDFFGNVAFHGKLKLGSGLDSEEFRAVFTSDGLIAAEGSPLLDETIVGTIDVNAGVAMNIVGDVAFIGQVFDPFSGTDMVRAVFTQDGLVVKVGDKLADGTTLEEISDGGVAINARGIVAFHGRTGGVKGVFTQHGLVAKVRDNLADSTTLNDIFPNGGVTINFYGDVAFHGRTGSTDAVLVGPAPLPPEVVVVPLTTE